MIADEDPNAPHTEEAAGWKLKQATKLTKNRERWIHQETKTCRKSKVQTRSSDRQVKEETDRWNWSGHTFLFADYFNLTVFKQSAVLKQQGGYGTSDRWLLHSAPTHTQKKDFTSTAGLIPVIIRLFVDGFVWVLLHLHLCLTHCLISADKNINRRANSGASSTELALHFVLPQPATCSC